MRIFIPGIPKNSNARSQWSKFSANSDRQKFRRLAARTVAEDVAANGGYSVPVRITAQQRAKVKRRRDPTGLAERLKGILDGLVDAGLVCDDDEEHIQILLGKTIINKTEEPGIYLSIDTQEPL